MMARYIQAAFSAAVMVLFAGAAWAGEGCGSCPGKAAMSAQSAKSCPVAQGQVAGDQEKEGDKAGDCCGGASASCPAHGKVAGDQQVEKSADATAHDGHAAASDGHKCCAMAKEAGMSCPMCNKAAKAALGKPVPNFKLSDTEGKAHMLSEFGDKTIVLVWNNPACPFVVRHNQEATLQNLQKEFGEKVAVVRVASNEGIAPEALAKEAQEVKLDTPILTDADGKVGKMFGAKTTPHVFVVSKGKLIYEGAIDNDPAGEKPAAERVNYVAQAIKAAQEGKLPETQSTKPYGCSVKYAESKKPADAPAKEETAGKS